MDISAEQINRILTEGKEAFHSEKDDVLSVGLRVSQYINVRLKKACRKLGVSFWQYLLDRISKRNEMPLLSEIIHSRANAL